MRYDLTTAADSKPTAHSPCEPLPVTKRMDTVNRKQVEHLHGDGT